MSHALKELLGNDHPLFVANIAALEKATGGAGVDVRLLADIAERAHAVLRKLNLDPANSTGKEVYQALKNYSKNDISKEQLKRCDYVLLMFGDEPVSFNIHDIVENAHHELPYSERSVGHAQRHLRAEIIKRYAEHDRTHHDTVHKLAEEMNVKLPDDEGYPNIHEPHPKKSTQTILSIGDIFTDAFIQLDEDSARIDKDEDGNERLSVPFGAKLPYDHVDIVTSVGPSPNAAISFARLGVESTLMAWLGDDTPGEESLRYLKSQGVDTSLMVTEEGKKSSYWYVLRYGSDRTMFVKSEKYKFEFKRPTTPPDWIYLAYTGEDSWGMHEELIKYLEEYPDIKLAFQPGPFHFEWGKDKLKDLYKRTHIVILNREEAMDVTGKPSDPIKDIAIGMHDLGPKIVVITDGKDGSYASYDWKMVTIPNYPDPGPPVDRTGAGDAFASTLVAALAMGESMDTAMTWAPINSMNVVQKIGAQAGLLNLDTLKDYLAKAPDDYKLTELKD